MAILNTWNHVRVEVNGLEVRGSWAIEDGMVKVRTPNGEKATQLGSLNPILIPIAILLICRTFAFPRGRSCFERAWGSEKRGFLSLLLRRTFHRFATKSDLFEFANNVSSLS